MIMKLAVLRDFELCSLIEADQRSEGSHCVYYQDEDEYFLLGFTYLIFF